MMEYLMYLRKSRADRDDESVMETLQRHKARLDEYCNANMIYVPEKNVLYEVSSGDSIASRPMMMELLHRVESKAFSGVLCIDMDRLSRGSGADQALVINTFKYSNTKIITPLKTYDFANETDEQFAELGLFLGRNEYRMIKRRMYQGRIDAVREGKYPSGNAPYGYRSFKLKGQKGYSLEVMQEQAEVVKTIFSMYVNENVGGCAIARWLNEHGYRDQFGNLWRTDHITKILSDPTYTGRVRFGRRRTAREMRDGQLVTVCKRNYEELICDGLHEAIISDDMFEAVSEIKQRRQIPHTRSSAVTQNPLCGLVECPFCGKKLALRSADEYGRALYCPTPSCKTRGSYLVYVEEAVLSGLNDWLAGYVVENKETSLNRHYAALNANLVNLKDEIQREKDKQKRIYDFFEQEIYSLKEYQERMGESKAKTAGLEETVSKIELELEAGENRSAIVPAVRSVLEHYNAMETPAEKNALLKGVLEKVVYEKTVSGRTHGKEFTLTLFPKVPKIIPR